MVTEQNVMTGTTPTGTPVRLSHEFVADQFWKLSDEMGHVIEKVTHLVGMADIAGELVAAQLHWRNVACRIDHGASERARARDAAAMERMMQD